MDEYATACRGLENHVGANNCFLNVVLQSLWHLPSFRDQFKKDSCHHSASSSFCLFCELQSLYIQYQYSESPVLNVEKVRIALEATASNTKAFNANSTGDAVEAFETILNYLHQQKSCSENCNCITHKVFGFRLNQVLHCACRSSSVSNSTQYLLRLYITQMMEISLSNPEFMLDELIGRAVSEDSACKLCSTSRVESHCVKFPKVRNS